MTTIMTRTTVEPQHRSTLENIIALAWKRKQITEAHVQVISKLLTDPRITCRESEVVDDLINAIIQGQIEVILCPLSEDLQS